MSKKLRDKKERKIESGKSEKESMPLRENSFDKFLISIDGQSEAYFYDSLLYYYYYFSTIPYFIFTLNYLE